MTTYEEAQGCPEVKQMLLEAAVMDLEDTLELTVEGLKDSLAGIGRAEGEARAVVQRIKNLLNGLQACETDKEEDLMKRSKTYPGYTNFYTYQYGERAVLMERTRHAQGGKVVYRQTVAFDTAAEAQRFFDTECGA